MQFQDLPPSGHNLTNSANPLSDSVFLPRTTGIAAATVPRPRPRAAIALPVGYRSFKATVFKP